MNRNGIETLLGALVIFIAAAFLLFSYNKGGQADVDGYKISADFSSIGGLKVGDAVQISGVNVGKVADVKLDAAQYVAVVTMDIENTIKIPADSTAMISSESLLGGKYLQIEPGGDEMMLQNGGKIEFTQAPQNLEQLLGKFIFASGDKDEDKKENQSAAPAEAATP